MNGQEIFETRDKQQAVNLPQFKFSKGVTGFLHEQIHVGHVDMLIGNNQYRTEEGLVDAKMTTKITELPPCLRMYITRDGFNYDYVAFDQKMVIKYSDDRFIDYTLKAVIGVTVK